MQNKLLEKARTFSAMTIVDHHHSHQSHDDQEPTKQSPPSVVVVVVVVVPFPLQSHLNQLLQLSHIISSHNIQVHYVGYALHISQVKSRASHALNDAKRIQFHDFPTPHFLSPLPTNTTFPSHLIPSFEASLSLRQPVMSLLTSLSKTATRVVIIHDALMSYVVQDSDSLPNTEAYIFHCVSAVSNFAFMCDAAGRHHDRPEIPSYEGCLVPEFEVFSNYQTQFLFKSGNKCGHLYNTCRLIDSEFLDSFLEEMRKIMGGNMKQWAIGPLETVTIFKNRSPNKVKGQGQNKCLEWLDKQEKNSVLYMSFGSTTFMEDEQIGELAIGLQKSGVKFLWVLRDADKGNVFDESEVRRPQLPLGFEERVKGKGIVVRDWAPQMEILGHSSTGGFMSHCGWNSCLESISLGVPIAAWPMHSDQPMNAVLVTDFLKVGVFVREWAKRDELVSSSVVEEVAKRLMKSEEGDEIRKKAEELGCQVIMSTKKGGITKMEWDSFIAHITRES